MAILAGGLIGVVLDLFDVSKVKSRSWEDVALYIKHCKLKASEIEKIVKTPKPFD